MRKFQKQKGFDGYFTPREGVITNYLNDISKQKVLDESEIKELIIKSKKGDQKATDLIVKANQRFIFSVAKRYAKGDYDLLCDLINEANIGLLKSISRYDVDSPNRFLSFSIHWIQKHIFSYLTWVNESVTVSNKGKTSKTNEIKNKFFLIEGRYPTSNEIIDILRNDYGINIINESDVYHLNINSIDKRKEDDKYEDYFNNQMESFNKTSLTEQLSNNLYEKICEDDYNKTIISNIIGILTEKEKNIIKMLYGIDQYRPLEVHEVADEIKMTNEGVRITKDRIIKKLKKEYNNSNYQYFV